MQRLVWWGLIIFFVIFSLWPTWYEIEHRNDLRPNRYFELIHNFPTDYNFYLSRIREGIEGRWTVVEKYTSEPHQGSYLHIFYLAMGWAGAWNRVPWERAGDVYHMGRIALAVVLLAVTAELARYSFKKFPWQLTAFLLAVTASTWPKLVHEWDGWRFGGYMPWWSVMDSLQRITFLPHLLFGQSLILFLLLALANRETMVKPYNWIFLGIIGFAMGIVFPPGILFVDTTIFIIILLELIYDWNELKELKKEKLFSWALSHILPRAIFILLSSPSLLYVTLMTSFYPWKRLAELDVIQPLPFNYIEYIKAVGPILPFGLIGLLAAFFKRERKMIVNVSWVIAWIALLIIFKSIPQQSPLRFSEMIPHVPLGMLVAYLFYVLIARARATIVLIGICAIPIGLLLTNFGVLYSSWLWQKDFVDHKIRAEFPLVPTGSYVMYPLKDFIGAMKFIQDSSKRTDVILAETAAGNYMPVYSGNTVYVGHDNTVNAAEKKAFVSAFFSGGIPVNDAQAWIASEKFRFIYYGPQEREENNWNKELEKTYPFLRVVYKNEFVTVYEPGASEETQ